MSAVLCAPQAWTFSSGSTASPTAPATNLSFDEPGMVWRSASLGGVYLTFQTAGLPFDTIALAKTNLRASDTVRVKMGSTASNVNGSNPTYSQSFAAFTGVAPLDGKSTWTLLLDAPVTHAFVRIEITSTGNPAQYVEASRLIIGQRVTASGVDIGDEENFQDGSVIDNSLGATTIDPYGIRMGRKVTFGNIKDVDYYTNWQSFFYAVGQKNAFLFMPVTEGNFLQRTTLFARQNADPKAVALASDLYRLEMSLLAT